MRLALLLAGLALGVGSVPAAPRENHDPASFYAARCAYCHGANGWGTRKLAQRVPPGEAELLKRKVLPAAYVQYVVRNGVGSMPQFTPTELTDPELQALAQWLANPAERK